MFLTPLNWGEMLEESMTQCFLCLFFLPLILLPCLYLMLIDFYCSLGGRVAFFFFFGRSLSYSISVLNVTGKNKKKKGKDHSFRDSRWLFARSCLDPRRGALYSQKSGGVKIVAQCQPHCQKKSLRMYR